MGLLDDIKNDVKRSGSNKSKLVFFREGTKKRIRFLQDLEDGYEVEIHGNWDEGLTAVCGKEYGQDCKYCDKNEELAEDDEDPRYDTKTNYVWSVYDYDTNKVELMVFKVSRCSPIPPLVAMYENYGTLTDRDYVITQVGKGITKSFTVIPQDKSKFRNAKAKPYSKQAMLKILLEAYPDTKTWEGKGKLKKRVDEPVEDDSDYDGDLGEDYSSMKPVELFKLCKERKIEVEKKKPKQYYINLLEEWDKAQEDWGDDDSDEDGDDWGDEEDEWEDE